MERVSTHVGSIPAIILVPHGYDDPNTSVIAEAIIEEIDAFAVINRGWERANHYDYYKDKANCNNIRHLHEDVVKEEFLEPILSYVNRILNAIGEPKIFIIHGVSNLVRNEVDNLDIIVGFGNGKPPSYTCPIEYKNLFLYFLEEAGLFVCEGKSGGAYSARRKSNLNQLFRTDDYYDESIFSLQIEVVRELRADEDIAKETGRTLASIIKEIINADEPWDCPKSDFPSI